MKVKDIPTGEVFCIGETPSYPKLKLDVSYVDMRDEIKGTPSITDELDARVMTVKELCEVFETSDADMRNWIIERQKKYL